MTLNEWMELFESVNLNFKKYKMPTDRFESFGEEGHGPWSYGDKIYENGNCLRPWRCDGCLRSGEQFYVLESIKCDGDCDRKGPIYKFRGCSCDWLGEGPSGERYFQPYLVIPLTQIQRKDKFVGGCSKKVSEPQ